MYRESITVRFSELIMSWMKWSTSAVLVPNNVAKAITYIKWSIRLLKQTGILSLEDPLPSAKADG